MFAEQICGNLAVIFATLLSVCLYILTGEMVKQCSLNITLPILLMSIGIFVQREKRRLRVFENRVLRRIFGPKRDEVTGEWRKLHNEELHDLYCSPTTVRVTKSRRLRWAGHVARMGEGRGFCLGNLRERDHWGDPGVGGG
jgi:hypothetical protein